MNVFTTIARSISHSTGTLVSRSLSRSLADITVNENGQEKSCRHRVSTSQLFVQACGERSHCLNQPTLDSLFNALGYIEQCSAK